MRFPWANIAILVTLLTLGITGYLGLVAGDERAAWRLWLHGAAAYTLLALFLWKSRIILGALRRKRVWTRARVAFLITLFALLATVAMGLLWTFDGPIYLAGFSLVSLHIYLAIPVMMAVVWHAWRMKFIVRVKGALDRRLFLRGGTAAVAGAALWQSVNVGKRVVGAPGASRRFTGSYERGSYSGRFPKVSWLFDNPSLIDPGDWRLIVNGAVRHRLELTLPEIQAMPAVTKDVLLDCTGGWYTVQAWTGVPVGTLLRQASVLDAAASVSVVAVSGYQRRFGLRSIDEFLLAYAVAGEPLDHGHGAPLRLVGPGRRGFEWVKWVVQLRINQTGPLWQLPLPLR